MTTPTDGIALPTNTEPSAPVAPRPRRRGWSLKAHLVVVVLAAIALVVLGGVLITANDYNRARQGALRDARFEAGLAADAISTSIPDLRALIVRSGASVGQATGGNVTALPPDKCNLSFQEFRSFKSGVLHIVLPDGAVMCSSRPGRAQPGERPYAGASWLTPVVQNGSATVVGPLRDPVSKEWALFVAAPIPSPGQPSTASPPAILAVVLDLTPLAATIHDSFLKLGGVSHLELLVTDAKRDRVVSRSIRPQQSAARPLPPSKYPRADSPKGALIRDIDGTERLYVGHSVNELNWHVYAGIAKSDVYKPARDALSDHLVAGAIIVLGLALVTLSGIFTVARR
jgi:hypothetical protein